MQNPSEGQPMASSLVNNKYRITRRIGGGSFGEIYMGVGLNNEKVRECNDWNQLEWQTYDGQPLLRHLIASEGD